MRVLLGVFAVLVVLAGAGAAQAQGIASNFDQLRVLVKPGDHITVIDPLGRGREGNLLDISGAALALQVDGRREEFAADDVQRITQRRHLDLGRGAQWGAGIGAGFGVFTMLAATGTCRSCGGFVLMSGLVWSGIGAGIGVGVSASSFTDHTIFAAGGAERKLSFAPIVDEHRKGAMVSVRW